MRVIFSAALAVLLMLQPVAVQAQQRAPLGGPVPQTDQAPSTDTAEQRSKLSDAAVIALVIAASIATYKQLCGPCACPNDTMKNGRACGGNSAYLRGGGEKPLCSPTDVTSSMIAAYRSMQLILELASIGSSCRQRR
jgi:hypothetical protein